MHSAVPQIVPTAAPEAFPETLPAIMSAAVLYGQEDVRIEQVPVPSSITRLLAMLQTFSVVETKLTGSSELA